MKVLVFTTLYPNNIWPNHGVFVKERMTHFAKLDKCEIKVIAPVPYYPPIRVGWRRQFSQVVKKEIIEGIDVYHPRYFMTPKYGMTFYGFLMYLSVLPLVKKINKDYNFDLIDSHFVYPDGYAAMLLGRTFKKPFYVSARGTDINFYKDIPVIRRLLRQTLLSSNKIIAVCQALKDEMVKIGIDEDKINVIPNGVDTDKFRPLPKIDARKKIGLSIDKRIILSVGSLIPRKGFDLLIKAFKILIVEYGVTDLIMLIIGEGKFQSELNDLIISLNLDKYIYFIGTIPHHELFVWYSSADLFCLTSKREGWPNVIMESLACGTPVIATNIWGVPEIINSESLGYLVERDERVLGEAMDKALKKTWDSSMMIKYARENTWGKVALSIMDVYNSGMNAEELG